MCIKLQPEVQRPSRFCTGAGGEGKSNHAIFYRNEGVKVFAKCKVRMYAESNDSSFYLFLYCYIIHTDRNTRSRFLRQMPCSTVLIRYNPYRNNVSYLFSFVEKKKKGFLACLSTKPNQVAPECLVSSFREIGKKPFPLLVLIFPI